MVYIFIKWKYGYVPCSSSCWTFAAGIAVLFPFAISVFKPLALWQGVARSNAASSLKSSLATYSRTVGRLLTWQNYEIKVKSLLTWTLLILPPETPVPLSCLFFRKFSIGRPKVKSRMIKIKKIRRMLNFILSAQLNNWALFQFLQKYISGLFPIVLRLKYKNLLVIMWYIKQLYEIRQHFVCSAKTDTTTPGKLGRAMG